jgi:serine/threonine protein kinase
VVDKPIGAGGTAMVYRVIHSKLNTAFALKVLTITSDSIRKRILLEGQVQASLRHVNIVAVTDVLDVGGSPGLVMEYIEGPSLERALKKYQLSMRDAETLFLGVVAGVKHAHLHGLVHRDLKPANVLLANSPNGYIPKVTDFGLAKVLQGDGMATGQTRSGIAMGTPSYMAPEQIQDASNVDQRADIFSLGCMLYELLTRRRVFPGEQALPIYNAICSGKYVSPITLLPNLPKRLEMAIGGCLAVDRDDRIPDCETLVSVFKGKIEWSVGDGCAVPEVPFDREAYMLEADAPIMTIVDASSKRPQKSAPAAVLAGLAAIVVDSNEDSNSADVGMFLEPSGDSLPEDDSLGTLLPSGEEKRRSLVFPLVLLLVLLLGSWLAMGAFWYVRSLTMGDSSAVVVPTVEPVPQPAPVEALPEPVTVPTSSEEAAPSRAVVPLPAPPTPAVLPMPRVEEPQAAVLVTVKLLSIPPTARVRLNGAERGRTPAKLELAEGAYEVRLSSGDAEAAFNIDVREGASNRWCYNFVDARRYEGSCPR